MLAIILFSHGSVLCGAERNLIDLAKLMRDRGDAPIVEVGFLNYTEPSFSLAVDRCIAAGATRVIVAPYFLIAGKFVVEDLAARVADEQARHRGIDIRTAAVIGYHPLMENAVLASAEGARPDDSWDDAIGEAAAWCREHPKCPLYASNICRAAGTATA